MPYSSTIELHGYISNLNECEILAFCPWTSINIFNFSKPNAFLHRICFGVIEAI